MKKNGFSLMEFLIAMSIGIAIMSLLLKLFTQSQRLLKMQEDTLCLLHNANTLQSILENFIKSAGQVGCPKLNNDYFNLTYGDYAISNKNKLLGIDGITSRAVTRYTESPRPMLDSMHIYAGAKFNYNRGDILLIANCHYAEIFQVAKVIRRNNYQEIIPMQALTHLYEQFSQVGFLEINHLYRTPENTLILEDISHRKNILLTGLTDLSFQYTVFENNHFQERRAAMITDWQNVVGVTIDADLAYHKQSQHWQFYVALHS